MPEEKENSDPSGWEKYAVIGLTEVAHDSIRLDTDWGFVIKLHALLEGTLAAVIIARFKEPLLSGIIRDLSISAEEDSKVAILKDLGLLTPDERRFIREFSRMRNAFAHDISYIDATVNSYRDKDPKRAEGLHKAIRPLLSEIIKDGEPFSPECVLSEYLREAIWLTVLHLVARLTEMVYSLWETGSDEPAKPNPKE